MIDMPLRNVALLALGPALLGCHELPTDERARGEALFANCVACHGVNGAGNPSIAAPAIAGLSRWYVSAQLQKFRTGVRGSHPEDAEGLRMRPMSLTLPGDADVEAVATYVASLPPVHPAPTLMDADAKAGAALYGTCAACHGADGKGNEALKAPPIASAHDWYLLSQLKKFKSGQRGGDSKDTSGLLMRPMAATLVDEQAMKNVIAHVMTLGR